MKYQFNHFTDNLVFYDSEFSSNDPYKGELLSVGMIDYVGNELYLEIDHAGEVSPWVKENILPTLKQKKVSRKEAVREIEKFVGKGKPYLVSHVYLYDVVYLHKLFNSKDINDLPFYWVPIDFPSILFGLGLDPYSLRKDDTLMRKVGVDLIKFKHTHNALADARLLREVYLKMIKH